MQSVWLQNYKKLNEIEAFLNERLKNAGVTVTIKQLHVLMSLYEQDGQHPSALANSVGLPATSFTPILDGIESIGLIGRIADNKDRRSVIVCLTSRGAELRGKVRRIWDETETKFKA